MGKVNQESTITFAEVFRSAGLSSQQHPVSLFDGKFMIYCQGMKLFIAEDFTSESLLKLLRVMK